jgi:DNA sulfur modification protein DndB
MIDSFEPLRTLAASQPEERITSRFRSRAGGHLLFRPVGLLFIVGAIRRLIDAGYQRDQVIAAIGKLNLELEAQPWERLIWDPINRRMLVSGDNRKVAEEILVYGLTRNEELIARTEKALRKEWAGLVGQTSSRAVSIPDWPKLRRPH